MASYILKKSTKARGLYLQIYKAEYDPTKKNTRNFSYKKIGYVSDLKEKGIEDPIAYYKEEVEELNRQLRLEKREKEEKIGKKKPSKLLGYFPLKKLLKKLNVENIINTALTKKNLKHKLFDVFSALVFARAVHPGSKRSTYFNVLPRLQNEEFNFSYKQILEYGKILGKEYIKVMDATYNAIHKLFNTKTDKVYFDCTNYYFEIDREDDLRRKGPSKEHRTDPIVGMGLLLDNNLIPMSMRLYPGNQSEKPLIRNMIEEQKDKGIICGRTIEVADKGLNCFENILAARSRGDGYIFSKSVKASSEELRNEMLKDFDLDNKDKMVENGWIFVGNGKKINYCYKSITREWEYNVPLIGGRYTKESITEKRIITYNPELAKKHLFEINKLIDKALRNCSSQVKKENYGECGKYMKFVDEDGNKITPSLDPTVIEKDKKCAGFNMLITSETNMADEEIYKTYHELWRIEETFRTLKSQLDARPVYVQTQDSIQGHFLINFIALQLIRVLQVFILEDKYGTQEIFRFIKDFEILKQSDRIYINLSTTSDVLKEIAKKYKIPLENLYLSSSDVSNMLS